MRKAIIAIVAIAIVVALFYAFRGGDDAGVALGQEVSGIVTNVNLEQAMVDGPYIILVQSDDGAEEAIHVPSMGLPLCAAREDIMSPSEISVGDRIEVRGTLTAEGAIVPCESPDHYLRAADAE